MATIQDLLALDLSKFTDKDKERDKVKKTLKTAIEDFLKKYDEVEEKEIWLETAQGSIDTFYDMAQAHVPEALAQTKRKESGKGDSKKPKKDSSPSQKEESESTKKISRPQTRKNETDLTQLTQNAIDVMTDLEKDLDGEDETILATTRMELEEALDQSEDPVFMKGLTQAIKNYEDWNMDLTDEKARKSTDDAMQKLKVRLELTEVNKDSKLRKLTDKTLENLLGIDLDLNEGDKGTLISIRVDLADSLQEEDDPKFTSLIKRAIEDVNEFKEDIADDEFRALLFKTVKPLENELEKLEKEKAEKSAKSKKVLKAFDEFAVPRLEQCKKVISEYHRKKREAAGPKPKKTRYTLLKERLLSIEKLTPESLKLEEKVLAKNKDILKETAQKLMTNWGMNQVKQMKKAIDEKFDEIEEKVETKEQKELAHKWKHDLPRTEDIIAYEKKHSKHLLEEAALEIVGKIGEAVSFYEKDKKKAFDYLNEHFNKGQLKEYLPNFILEEMKKVAKSS